MSPGVLDGTRPYRFLDETSVSNGYVRLRRLLLLVLLAGLILGYELGSLVEDRDAGRGAGLPHHRDAVHRVPRVPPRAAASGLVRTSTPRCTARLSSPRATAPSSSRYTPDALCLRAVTVPASPRAPRTGTST